MSAPRAGLPYYHVDAFVGEGLRGNAAGVCPLERWLPDAEMQAIAAEMNLSETAFFVRGASVYELRWFTPAIEVNLCGHATLASAHVLFTYLLDPTVERVTFSSRSGLLHVAKDAEKRLALDFPAQPARPAVPPAWLLEGLGLAPREVLAARSYLCVYDTEAEVRVLAPDMARLRLLDRPVIVSAPGDGCDFVSRFFAPTSGVPEDPVTGSSHCTLVPYWAARLRKPVLHALQVSARGGELFLEDRGPRVSIAGRAATWLRGTIELCR